MSQHEAIERIHLFRTSLLPIVDISDGSIFFNQLPDRQTLQRLARFVTARILPRLILSQDRQQAFKNRQI